MIVLIGMAFSAAAFAIIAKARVAKPKKAEKWEKAQIVKQLLALSEGEDKVNGTSRQQSASQSPTPRSRAAVSTSRSGTVRSA